MYRNPGVHFGDIHVLNARYVAELEDFVGNAKYGIFFSTKGRRSVGSEIANGDFDGDLYWVSRSPQVGIQFMFFLLDLLFLFLWFSFVSLWRPIWDLGWVPVRCAKFGEKREKWLSTVG